MKKSLKVFALLLTLVMTVVTLGSHAVFATEIEPTFEDEITDPYWIYFDLEDWNQYTTEYSYMSDEKASASADFKLPKNRFVVPGYDFVEWVEYQYDEATDNWVPGRTWADEAVIPAGTYESDDEVSLYARFTPRDTSVDIQNGEFEFSIRGGETAVFNGIPSGVGYQVWEYTPDGWVLVDYRGNSGSIKPLQESVAEFTNKYDPETVSVIIRGTKMIDNNVAPARSYWFSMFQDGKFIASAQNTDGGLIAFDPIYYTEPGVYTYTVKEWIPYTSSIVDPTYDYDSEGNVDEEGTAHYPNPEYQSEVGYDTHTETVVVTVTRDDAGNLHADVQYDENGMNFFNKSKPGDLRIIKDVYDDTKTEANENDLFEFEVTLKYENGEPYTEPLYWYVKPGTEQYVEPPEQIDQPIGPIAIN